MQGQSSRCMLPGLVEGWQRDSPADSLPTTKVRACRLEAGASRADLAAARNACREALAGMTGPVCLGRGVAATEMRLTVTSHAGERVYRTGKRAGS